MNGLRVLREVTGVDDFVLNSLVNERDKGAPIILEYEDGSRWVDNDRPWDTEIARALVRYGGRFAVADAEGGIVAGPYRALDKAEKARASAKMTVAAMVDVADDEFDAPVESVADVPDVAVVEETHE